MSSLFSKDSLEAKKSHECIKRALILMNGKRVFRLRGLCTCRGFHIDNGRCEININISDPSPDSLINEDGSSSYCNGCYLYRRLEYVSDTLRYLKAALQVHEFTEAYTLTREILIDILKLTMKKCYLTFDSDLYMNCRKYVSDLNYTETLDLVSKMYDFCVENKIK